MPLEYKVYGCKFKCGRKHSKKRSAIERHEHECFMNPDNKTCLTCKYEDKFNGYSGTWEEPPEDPYRECNKERSELYEYQRKLIDVAFTHSLGCIVNPIARRIYKECWNNREEVIHTLEVVEFDDFNLELAEEIASVSIMIGCEHWECKE